MLLSFCYREKVVLRRDQTCNLLGSFVQCFWQHQSLMDKTSFSRFVGCGGVFLVCWFFFWSPIVEVRESWSHGGSVAVLAFFPLFFLFVTILCFSCGPCRLLHWPQSWRAGLSHHFFVPQESTRLSTFVVAVFLFSKLLSFYLYLLSFVSTYW